MRQGCSRLEPPEAAGFLPAAKRTVKHKMPSCGADGTLWTALDGQRVLAVEQTERSVKLHEVVREPGQKLALVFGNEVDGVSQEVVDECDASLEIPQYGTKHSLNVSVCAGIVLWKVTDKH